MRNIKEMDKRLDEREEEITELNENITWWQNRFNAVERDNKQLRKALETKHYCKYANNCNELYDCTREEYNSMAESNMKLSLENYELKQALLDIKEYIKENKEDGFDEDGYDDAWYDKVEVMPILDIVSKTIGDKE